MTNFTVLTDEQAAHDEDATERYLEALRELQAENARLRIGSVRYEKLRKLNAEQFALLYRANINTGIHFDTLVDALGETK